MFGKLIASIILKSASKDVVKMGLKKNHKENVVKERLGVSTIDEFMKLDVTKSK